MAEADEILKGVFGFERFRPGQREIVDAVLAGREVLAIMPTGGGKSLCYQLPALVLGGLTVVISPLIALMRDQVAALREAGVAAGALTSANTAEETARVMDALGAGRLRILYMAPERLSAAGTRGLLAKAGVSRLAVDEAHCVSQWGHDFRPDYLTIGDFRAALGVPMAAFTATADAETRAEIARRLFPEPPLEFLRGFDRPNLFLGFEAKAAPQKRITDFAAARRGQAGIVYCASRKRAEILATALAGNGLPALAYHAGLEPGERSVRQDRFLAEDGIVMAATVAFGMGVDKPDVRWVAHADLPKSVEAYYQEIGRAGRDGAPAETLTLYGIDDIKLRRRQIDETDAPETRKRADHARLQALLALAEAPHCRRQTLLTYFGELDTAPCGNCDLCRNPPELMDGTEAVQKALSAMLRTGERFGVEHLVQVLRGEAGERVARLGHDALPTYGVGRDFTAAEWRELFRQIYARGFAGIGEMGGWHVSDAGWRVLRGHDRPDLCRPRRSATPARPAERRTPIGDPADAELFEALRAKRSELARTRGVPAYVIFPDATLTDMAARKPCDQAELSACHGVGTKKLKSFGDIFLEVINGRTASPEHPARARLETREADALVDRLQEVALTLSRGETGAEKPLSCSTSLLARIAAARPTSRADLSAIRGMDDARLERFGTAFLALLADA